MLESIFIVSLIIGFLFLLKGIDDERLAYSFVSILAFFFAAAGSLYIETPGTSTTFIDYAASVVCFGLIFLNIVYIVSMQFEAKRTRKYRL